MPEAPINFIPEPPNKKDHGAIEVTSFSTRVSNPNNAAEKPAEAKESANTPAKE